MKKLLNEPGCEDQAWQNEFITPTFQLTPITILRNPLKFFTFAI